MHTYSLADYVHHIEAGKWDHVGEMLLSSAEQRCGAQRIRLRQSTQRGLKNRALGFQTVIGCGVAQAHTAATRHTARPWKALTAAIMYQQPAVKGFAIAARVPVGAVQRFPIQAGLLEQPEDCFEETA
jgi:hypothetical protein